jgi:Ca2+/H+ antiporter, TMEM165/GDT1 family
MTSNWMHAWPTAFAAFLASAVEALPVVLAVGVTRGWRGALIESVLRRVGASR